VFDVRIEDTPVALEQTLRKKAAGGRTVRLLASYAREWKTKGAARPHALPATQQDFYEPYLDELGAQQYWNKVWNFIPQNGSDYTWFIQAPLGSPMHSDPLCEVGCPYAVRGFDFDHIGVLWFSDLVWRGSGWSSDPAHVYDTGLDRSVSAARRELQLGPAHDRLRAALSQAYRILLTRGMSGCHIWLEDKGTRDHLRACLGMTSN